MIDDTNWYNSVEFPFSYFLVLQPLEIAIIREKNHFKWLPILKNILRIRADLITGDWALFQTFGSWSNLNETKFCDVKLSSKIFIHWVKHDNLNGKKTQSSVQNIFMYHPKPFSWHDLMLTYYITMLARSTSPWATIISSLLGGSWLYCILQ